MKTLLVICLLGAFWPLFAEYKSSEKYNFLTQTKYKALESYSFLAQNETSKTFDPFIDYGEFQDNVAEEESIIFFQTGRSLTLSFLGGYEPLTLNLRQIFGDGLIVGANISFFLDLRFAFQVSAVFPSGHYHSLFYNNSSFSHYGIDLKYYLNRQYLNKEKDILNPYLIFGPFWMNVKFQIPSFANSTSNPNTPPPSATPSPEEARALSSFNSVGIKLGAGFETPFVKQSFIGLEVSYLYTVLPHENEILNDLSLPEVRPARPNLNLIERLLYPNRPEIENYLFFGDLINITVLLGVNF